VLYPPSLIRLLFTVVSEAVRRVGQFVAVGCVRCVLLLLGACVVLILTRQGKREKGRRMSMTQEAEVSTGLKLITLTRHPRDTPTTKYD